MKTVDLAAQPASIEDILRLAERDDVVVRTGDGKVFAITEVARSGDEDDFADEVSLVRHNRALRELLAERSKEPGKYTLDDVRQMLGVDALEG